MKNASLNTDLVDKAIIFATNAHHGTERRGKGVPYIVHPVEVLSIAATLTSDPCVLAAAVLHDTIEDTDVTLDDIAREFGNRVANIVDGETDYKCDASGAALTWQQRKQRDIDNLSKASTEVKMVALSDKLSNMRTIARDYRLTGDNVWQLFRIKDKATHAWRHKGLLNALSELKSTDAFAEYSALINEVFG